LVLEEYQKHKKLKNSDLDIIPQMITATYGANCLAGSFEYYGKKNKTEESLYWMELGSLGAKLAIELIN